MLKAGFVYLVINIIARGMPILMAPLFINKLGVYGYGIYTLSLTVESLMIPFATFNTVSALQVMHRFDGSDKDLLCNCLTVNLIASTICLAAIGIAYYLAIDRVATDVNIIFAGFASASLGGLVNVVNTLCRLKSNIRGAILVQLTQPFTFLTLLLLTLGIDWSASVVVWWRVIGIVCGVVISIAYIWRRSEISLNFSSSSIVKIIKFCAPLVGASVVSLWASGIDKIFLAKYYSAEEVGKVAALSQIVSLLSVLASTVGAVWIPWVMQLKAKREGFRAERIFRAGGVIVLFGGIFVILSICFLPWFVKMTLPKWPDQLRLIVTLMVLCAFFELLYLLSSPFALVAGKPGISFLFSIVTASVSVVAMTILVPNYAAVGGVIANLIGWITLAALHAVFAGFYMIKTYR